MRNLNKRGLSDVVANLLIMLLGITAVVLVASSSYQLVNLDRFEKEYSCYEVSIMNPLTIQKACYNSESKDIELTLSRKLEKIDLDDFQIIAQLDGESQKWSCGLSCGDCRIQEEGSIKRYFISSNSKPKTVSIAVNDCKLEDKIVLDC